MSHEKDEEKRIDEQDHHPHQLHARKVWKIVGGELEHIIELHCPTSNQNRREGNKALPIACRESCRESKQKEQSQDESPEITLLVQLRFIFVLDIESLGLDKLQAVLPMLHSFEIQMRITICEQCDLGDIFPKDRVLVIEVDASQRCLEGVHIIRGH